MNMVLHAVQRVSAVLLFWDSFSRLLPADSGDGHAFGLEGFFGS